MNFFNKTKYIDVPLLGKLERKKGFIFSKLYSWIGEVKILNNIETFIALDEVENKPDTIQVAAITDFVTNFNDVYSKQINYWLGLEKLNLNEQYLDWENNYFVGMITPSSDNEYKLELTLEPINTKDLNFLFIEIENKSIVSLKN